MQTLLLLSVSGVVLCAAALLLQPLIVNSLFGDLAPSGDKIIHAGFVRHGKGRLILRDRDDQRIRKLTRHLHRVDVGQGAQPLPYFAHTETLLCRLG